MPELPDLQVFSANLSKKLKGKKLRKIEARITSRLNVPKTKLKKTLEGATVKEIFREGKELHIRFSNGHVLGLHMMLHGKLVWMDETLEELKYVILEMHFENGPSLALTDFQKKATPTLDPIVTESPDALSKEFNFTYLKNIAAKKKTNIKSLITDQDIVRGIGNAYADEILWEARISPFSIARSIPPEKLRVLVNKVSSVMKAAEKNIRTKEPHIIGGEVRDFLKIHNAGAKTSPAGARIETKAIGGRKTYFTKEQVEFT